MSWHVPTRWREPLVVGGIFFVVMFGMVWAGYGNGPTPKFWGDPIEFRDVVAKWPKILMFAVLVTVIARFWEKFEGKYWRQARHTARPRTGVVEPVVSTGL